MHSGAPGMGREAPVLPRVLTALLLFGIAFGYVEAAVVVYVRVLYEPLHQQLYPGRAGRPRAALDHRPVESRGPAVSAPGSPRN